FPYTTLFRSHSDGVVERVDDEDFALVIDVDAARRVQVRVVAAGHARHAGDRGDGPVRRDAADGVVAGVGHVERAVGQRRDPAGRVEARRAADAVVAAGLDR